MNDLELSDALIWARRIVRRYSQASIVGEGALVDVIAHALRQARIQGARDALKPAPHLDEMTALSQEMGLYDAPDDPHAPGWFMREVDKASTRVAEWEARHPATPSPAIAPLREAVALSPDEARRFMEIMNNPPAPTPEAIAMMRQARERFAETHLDAAKNLVVKSACELHWIAGKVDVSLCQEYLNALWRACAALSAAQGAAAEERTP